MDTAWNLRDPGQREAFAAAARKFVKGRKSPFKSTELAEALECNLIQARSALNAMIQEGVLTYEGQTRATVYQRVA